MSKDDNISLQRIFDVIREIADNHKMIEDNNVGDIASRGTSKGQEKDDEEKKPRELNFPYLFIDYVGSSLEVGRSMNVQAKTYRINLFVADKHSDNAENDEDILSDTDSILTDLIIYITQNKTLNKYIVGIGTTEIQPARHVTIHEAFGCQCTLSIKVQASVCWELLPFADGNC